MKANREYKSTLFSKLFSNTDNLRELYNAIADTNYDKDTPIEISTLDDVLSDAIKETTRWGLSHNILGTFLTEHGSEVNNMLMVEYSLERDIEIREKEHRAAMAEKDAEIAEKDAKIEEQEALIEKLQSEARGK